MEIIKKILIIVLFSSSILFALKDTEDNKTRPLTKVEKFSQVLKKQLTVKRSPLLKNIKNKKILKKVYLENKFTPLWINDKGDLNKVKYKQLFTLISNDLTLNKNGFIYKHNQELISQSDNNFTQNDLLKMELKLSSHYYNFLKHLLYGEIEWKNFSRKLSSLKKYKINASWLRYKPTHNLITLLSQPNIHATVEEITPKRFGYNSLLQALERLYKMEEDGGWKKLPYFKRLKLGNTGDIVIQLKNRLKYSGDYRSCEEKVKKSQKNLENNESNLSQTPRIEKEAIFDECLDIAVKRFQKRHGLEVDGIVGGGTRKALNVPVEEKIKTVLLNIDRIKWLPRDKQKRYLIVNIPEFMLYYIEHERTNKSLRVITGNPKHPTPVFSEEISYIVLNPYWKVPEGIVRREIIPAMIKNPNYLKRQGIHAHTNWNERSPIVNVSGLFWEDYLYGNKKFPYRLMQPPGPRNALGKIKFKFPNRFAVYLHDTPTRYLFKRTKRAFSHGCVRLSNPVSLLDTISSFNEDINMTKATKKLKGKRKQVLNVKNKLPIHIVYLTAGINNDNELSFRNDIYRYDKFMKRTIR